MAMHMRIWKSALTKCKQPLIAQISSPAISSKNISSLRHFTSAPSHSHDSHDSEYDVAIVGGGIVGATLACTLATSPLTSSLRIALLEPKPPQSFSELPLPADPEVRVSAISPASVRLFQAIGAWDSMKNYRVAPFYDMQVWDAVGGGSIEFDSSLLSDSSASDSSSHKQPLGYIVENRILQTILFEKLRTLASNNPKIDILTHPLTRISFSKASALQEPVSQRYSEAIEHSSEKKEEKDFARLYLSHSKSIKARLVVSAEGSASAIRDALAIPTLGVSYKHRAVVATVRTIRPHTTAFQRFLPTGPIAMLPCSNDFSNIVWSTDPSHAEYLLSLSEEHFIEAVNLAFYGDADSVLGKSPIGTSVSPLGRILAPFARPVPQPPLVTGIASSGRAAFSLKLLHAREYTRPRVALIGDAAHTVHPLAGQGVNLGILDAAELARALQKCVEAGGDVGDQVYLSAYEKIRKPQNAAMLAGLHSIQRIFSVSSSPVSFLRSAGMLAVNAVSPIKQQFMKQAVGADIDVSTLGSQ